MTKEVISNADLENFFDSFIRQTIKDLREDRTVYAFYQEQVDEIKKVYPDILVSCKDGIFVLTRME